MKVYEVHDSYGVIVDMCKTRELANKVRDYLGAGHYVTPYEVRETLDNNQK